MKARVYFNLHKQMLSVQHKVNGVWKVVRHTDNISLQNVIFKVSEAGRQRVLREKRKNVHAYIEGEEIPFVPKFHSYESVISYNPYKHSTFIITNWHNEPVDEAHFAKIENKKVFGYLTKYQGKPV